MSDTSMVEALEQWKKEHSALNRRRDSLIRAAYRAGVTKRDIWQASGVARTTIDRVLGKSDD